MSRPLIAFCTTDIELVYANILCRGVRDAAREFDANLIVLPGKALKAHYEFQYQYNVLYDFVDAAGVDGVVMSGGAVGNFVLAPEFNRWLGRFKSIPMVSIAAPIPHGPHIYTDNEVPFFDIVRHLIESHGRRNIAFVAGSTHNPDAQARFAGYKKALAKSGISYRSEYYVQGDFTIASVADAVHQLLDERGLSVDAIACANDEMAMAVLSQLRARCLRVPEDI